MARLQKLGVPPRSRTDQRETQGRGVDNHREREGEGETDRDTELSLICLNYGHMGRVLWSV